MKKHHIFRHPGRYLRMLIFRILNRKNFEFSEKAANARIRKASSAWVGRKGYCDRMSMEEVAAELHTSREQLAHWCRNELGRTFHDWRTELRIAEARRLIREEPTMSLAAIREAVGITDKSNFRRYFVRFSGCTPAKWRLEN